MRMTVSNPKWAFICAITLVYLYTFNNIIESDISYFAKILQATLDTLEVPGTIKVFREFLYFLYVFLVHQVMFSRRTPHALQRNLRKYAQKESKSKAKGRSRLVRQLTKAGAHGTHGYVDQVGALQLDALKRFLRKSDSRWHFLYFFPLPHQHGSFRPGLRISLG
jgi:hypothetical protein